MIDFMVRDGCLSLVWIGCNLLLGSAAWKTSWKLFPQDTLAQRLAHAIVIGWAIVTIVVLILGTAGVIGGWPLLVSVGVTCLFILALGGKIKRQWCKTTENTTSGWETTNRACSDAIKVQFDSSSSGSEFAWLRLWVWVVIWGFLIANWSVHLVVHGLMIFPRDYDSLVYHIPLVDQWLQAKSLYVPDCRSWSFPGGNELIALWMVAPFSGDFLIALTNIPAVLLLAVGSFELARTVGLSRTFCSLAALAALSIFCVKQQLVNTKNDVAVASLFVICMAYGLRYVRAANAADLFLAMVSLGLLAGVKFYSLGYAVVAGTTITAAVVYMRGWRGGTHAASLLALGLTLGGGYWYTRNALVTGNPFYPAGTSGDVLQEKLRSRLVTSSLLGNGRPEVLPLFVGAVWRMTGVPHFAAFMGLPFLVTWLVMGGIWLRSYKKDKVKSMLRLALAFLLVASGLVLGVTPFAVEDIRGTLNHLRLGYTPIRYGLCFFTTIILSLTVVLQDMTVVLRRLGTQWRGWALLGYALPVIFGVGIASQYAFLPRHVQLRDQTRGTDYFLYYCWVESLLIATGLVYLTMNRWPRFRRGILLAISACIAMSVVVGVGWLSQRWHEGFSSHYDKETEFLTSYLEERNDLPNTILCAAANQVYPFFGSRRQFHVCQLRQMDIRSYAWFLDYLRQREATILVIIDTTGRFEWVADWAWQHRQVFQPLCNERIELGLVFRVRLDAIQSLLEKSPTSEAAHDPHGQSPNSE